MYMCTVVILCNQQNTKSLIQMKLLCQFLRSAKRDLMIRSSNWGISKIWNLEHQNQPINLLMLLYRINLGTSIVIIFTVSYLDSSFTCCVYIVSIILKNPYSVSLLFVKKQYIFQLFIRFLINYMMGHYLTSIIKPTYSCNNSVQNSTIIL